MKTGHLVYITIPEKLHNNFSGRIGHLFDPAVPLPVELPPGMLPAEAQLDSGVAGANGGLTAEMILSGMLLDLAGNPAGEYADYYRRLIAVLRPGIASELETASRIKAQNGDYDSAEELLALMEGLRG